MNRFLTLAVAIAHKKASLCGGEDEGTFELKTGLSVLEELLHQSPDHVTAYLFLSSLPQTSDCPGLHLLGKVMK
jgi:hypothetical protein